MCGPQLCTAESAEQVAHSCAQSGGRIGWILVSHRSVPGYVSGGLSKLLKRKLAWGADHTPCNLLACFRGCGHETMRSHGHWSTCRDADCPGWTNRASPCHIPMSHPHVTLSRGSATTVLHTVCHVRDMARKPGLPWTKITIALCMAPCQSARHRKTNRT